MLSVYLTPDSSVIRHSLKNHKHLKARLTVMIHDPTEAERYNNNISNTQFLPDTDVCGIYVTIVYSQ